MSARFDIILQKDTENVREKRNDMKKLRFILIACGKSYSKATFFLNLFSISFVLANVTKLYCTYDKLQLELPHLIGIYTSFVL